METLFSKKLLDKYFSIRLDLSVVYKPELGKFKVFTLETQYFYVNDLDEITEERLDEEVRKQERVESLRNTIFTEPDELEDEILKSVHGSI